MWCDIMCASRYIWDNQYYDLDPEVRKRYEELDSKKCTEQNKQKKKNALMNAAVPRGISAKQGGTITTGMTAMLHKLVTFTDTHFDEEWDEAITITELKGQLGLELYKEGLVCGDIEERPNRNGKMMAYRHRERVMGRKRTLASSSSAKKQEQFDAKEFQAHIISFE